MPLVKALRCLGTLIHRNRAQGPAPGARAHRRRHGDRRRIAPCSPSRRGTGRGAARRPCGMALFSSRPTRWGRDTLRMSAASWVVSSACMGISETALPRAISDSTLNMRRRMDAGRAVDIQRSAFVQATTDMTFPKSAGRAVQGVLLGLLSAPIQVPLPHHVRARHVAAGTAHVRPQ